MGGLLLLAGCTSTGPARGYRTAVVPAEETLTEGPLPPGPAELFSARLDSVATLFSLGRSDDFSEAKAQLQEDIEAYLASAHPAGEDSLLEGILSVLRDSLVLAQEYSHRYLVETDSMALAVQTWPEQAEPLPPAPEPGPFPYLENRQIQFWLDYFTGPGRRRFARALARMEKYREVVEGVLSELGLPKELAVVPLIESGFYMKARSRARAVGPWQFLAGTARLYGLRVNWWIDERRDLVASTYAAGHYLKDLYELWDSWLLALAAYNAGEYRVARAVLHQRTRDFWKLDLPPQTKRYVPKFLAALYIVRDPAAYGFELPRAEPFRFDEVRVSDATDLSLIAKLAGCSLAEIRALNPSLLRWCTPPRAEVAVRVPRGKGHICAAKLRAIPPASRVTWRRHRVRRGETLWQIARKYGTSIATLKRLNGIRNSRLIRAGASLVVPVRGVSTRATSSRPSYKGKRRKLSREQVERYAKRALAPPGYRKVRYMVRDHQTLGEIAEIFHTRASRIRRWNHLSRRSFIYPGQRLVIYVPRSFDLSRVELEPRKPSPDRYVRKSYVVRKGDTFASISRRFGVRVSDLLAWNHKTHRSKIRPGEKLEIWQEKD